MPQILTLRQIKDGTGFKRDASFINTADRDLRNILGLARACIAEGIHEDRDFQREALQELDRLIAEMGD